MRPPGDSLSASSVRESRDELRTRFSFDEERNRFSARLAPLRINDSIEGTFSCSFWAKDGVSSLCTQDSIINYAVSCNQRRRRRTGIKPYVRRSTFIPVDSTSGRSCWSFWAALKVKINSWGEANLCHWTRPGPVSQPHLAWLFLITLEWAILVLPGAIQG